MFTSRQYFLLYRTILLVLIKLRNKVENSDYRSFLFISVAFKTITPELTEQ